MKRFCQLARVAGLTLGAALVGLFVGVIVGTVYSKTVPRGETRLPRPWGFTNEGEPFLMRPARESDRRSGFIHFADLLVRKGERKPPLEEIGVVFTDMNGAAFAEPHETEGITLPGHTYLPVRRWGEYHKSFQNFQETWNLVWDAGFGGGYFAGYDEEAKQQIGFIGTAGFREQPPPREEWFALQGYQTWDSRTRSSWLAYGEVLNCGTRVFHVNFNTREVRSLFEHLPSPARSLAVTSEIYPTLVGWAARSVVVRTDTALCVVDLHGKDPFASPAAGRERLVTIPPFLRNRSMTIFKRPGDALTIEVFERPQPGNDLQLQGSIYVLAPDGTLGPPRRVAASGVLSCPPRVLLWPLCSPLAQGLSSLLIDAARFDDYDGATTWYRYVANTLWCERSSLAAVFASALALATVCYLRESRRHASLIARITWPTFVLLLGIPGWIGYRFGLR